MAGALSVCVGYNDECSTHVCVFISSPLQMQCVAEGRGHTPYYTIPSFTYCILVTIFFHELNTSYYFLYRESITYILYIPTTVSCLAG